MYGVQYQQEALMMGVKDKCSNEQSALGRGCGRLMAK